jgi:hypothetical protein
VARTASPRRLPRAVRQVVRIDTRPHEIDAFGREASLEDEVPTAGPNGRRATQSVPPKHSPVRVHDEEGLIPLAAAPRAQHRLLAKKWGRRTRFWLPAALTWVRSRAMAAFDGLNLVLSRLLLFGTRSGDRAGARLTPSS